MQLGTFSSLRRTYGYMKYVPAQSSTLAKKRQKQNIQQTRINVIACSFDAMTWYLLEYSTTHLANQK